jgi:hypothetical protein
MFQQERIVFRRTEWAILAPAPPLLMLDTKTQLEEKGGLVAFA